jgi:hypothetical protein
VQPFSLSRCKMAREGLACLSPTRRPPSASHSVLADFIASPISSRPRSTGEALVGKPLRSDVPSSVVARPTTRPKSYHAGLSRSNVASPRTASSPAASRNDSCSSLPSEARLSLDRSDASDAPSTGGAATSTSGGGGAGEGDEEPMEMSKCSSTDGHISEPGSGSTSLDRGGEGGPIVFTSHLGKGKHQKHADDAANVPDEDGGRHTHAWTERRRLSVRLASRHRASRQEERFPEEESDFFQDDDYAAFSASHRSSRSKRASYISRLLTGAAKENAEPESSPSLRRKVCPSWAP